MRITDYPNSISDKQWRLVKKYLPQENLIGRSVVLPKRWNLERAFARINRHRRTSKDYEVLTENSEAIL